MDEDRFRSLMRKAVGDEAVPPWLTDAVLARVERPVRPASRAPLFALVAVFLVLAVLAIAIAPRLLRGAPPAVPGTITKSIDPFNCTLPLLRNDSYFRSATPVVPGFLNTHTGHFTVDAEASAALAGMPADQPGYWSEPPPATAARTNPAPPPAMSYDVAARRWLPVPLNRISPDGMSYAYLVNTSPPQPGEFAPRTVMRYDITAGKSVRLWVSNSSLDIQKWTPAGIFVAVDSTLSGGAVSTSTWIVDPQTGKARQAPPASPVKRSPGAQDRNSPPPTPSYVIDGVPVGPGSGMAFTSLGVTADGENIIALEKGPFPGTLVLVYYTRAADRHLVVIYDSRKGAVPGFNPQSAYADSTGIWLSDGYGLDLWHWDQKNGLRQVPTDVPGGQYVWIAPAAPCF